MQKMEKVTRTVYMTLWEIANRPARPKVDKQLPAQLSGGLSGERRRLEIARRQDREVIEALPSSCEAGASSACLDIPSET